MARAVLIFGGNIGRVEQTFAHAIGSISQRIGVVTQRSDIYMSEPWGEMARGTALFRNQVVEVETNLDPEQLLQTTQSIEQEYGRNRAVEHIEKEHNSTRYASRPLDIDILFYDELVMTTDQLTIPHPGIECREFVLEPLEEIMPERVHPLTGRTVSQMLQRLKHSS